MFLTVFLTILCLGASALFLYIVFNSKSIQTTDILRAEDFVDNNKNNADCLSQTFLTANDEEVLSLIKGIRTALEEVSFVEDRDILLGRINQLESTIESNIRNGTALVQKIFELVQDVTSRVEINDLKGVLNTLTDIDSRIKTKLEELMLGPNSKIENILQSIGDAKTRTENAFATLEQNLNTKFTQPLGQIKEIKTAVDNVVGLNTEVDDFKTACLRELNELKTGVSELSINLDKLKTSEVKDIINSVIREKENIVTQIDILKTNIDGLKLCEADTAARFDTMENNLKNYWKTTVEGVDDLVKIVTPFKSKLNPTALGVLGTEIVSRTAEKTKNLMSGHLSGPIKKINTIHSKVDHLEDNLKNHLTDKYNKLENNYKDTVNFLEGRLTQALTVQSGLKQIFDDKQTEDLINRLISVFAATDTIQTELKSYLGILPNEPLTNIFPKFETKQRIVLEDALRQITDEINMLKGTVITQATFISATTNNLQSMSDLLKITLDPINKNTQDLKTLSQKNTNDILQQLDLIKGKLNP